MLIGYNYNVMVSKKFDQIKLWDFITNFEITQNHTINCIRILNIQKVCFTNMLHYHSTQILYGFVYHIEWFHGKGICTLQHSCSVLFLWFQPNPLSLTEFNWFPSIGIVVAIVKNTYKKTCSVMHCKAKLVQCWSASMMLYFIVSSLCLKRSITCP